MKEGIKKKECEYRKAIEEINIYKGSWEKYNSQLRIKNGYAWDVYYASS